MRTFATPKNCTFARRTTTTPPFLFFFLAHFYWLFRLLMEDIKDGKEKVLDEVDMERIKYNVLDEVVMKHIK